MACLGPLLALAYAALGLLLPGALPLVLLLGTVGDWMLPIGDLNIFSNEWALLGAWLGLGLRQVWRGDLPAFPRGPLLWAAAALALVLGLHALVPGPLGAGLKDLLRTLQFLSGVFLAAWLLPGAALRPTARGMALFFAVAAALGVAQVCWPQAGWMTEFEGEHPFGRAFFQHHNQFGAFLCAAGPVAIALAPGRLARLAGALLLAGAIGASGSRGAALGLALAVFTLALFLPGRRRWQALGLLLALAGLALLASPGLRHRLGDSLNSGRNGDRVLITSVGREILGDAWVWGRGPGVVQRELPERLRARNDVRAADLAAFSSHLHDLWLQWTVEQGLLLALAWAGFLGVLFVRGMRRIGEAAGAALAVAVLAFALQAFTDHLLLHARGLQIALSWGLALAALAPAPRKSK